MCGINVYVGLSERVVERFCNVVKMLVGFVKEFGIYLGRSTQVA